MAKKSKKASEPTGIAAIIAWFRTLLGAIVVVMLINGAIVASFVVPTASMERTVMTGDFLFVNKFIYGPTTPQVVPFINMPLPFYKFPGYRKPKLSDVIVFIYPGNRDEIEPSVFNYYLKRCCGTPGDEIQLKDKQLFVNGTKIPLAPNGVYIPELPDHPANFPFGNDFSRDNYGPIRIPKAGDVIKINPENLRVWDVLIKREGHEVVSSGSEIQIDGKVATSYTVKRNYYFGMGDNRDNSEDSRSWGFIPEDNIIGSPMFVYWSWDTNLPLISEFFTKLTTIRWSRIATIIR
jgi:signal peptidase I